jgi:hypothetical protein
MVRMLTDRRIYLGAESMTPNPEVNPPLLPGSHRTHKQSSYVPQRLKNAQNE